MASTPTTSLRKVFFDASVLFAAAYSAIGYARDLIVAAIQVRVALAVSAFAVLETRRNLAAKSPRALVVFDEFCATTPLEYIEPPNDLVREASRIVAARDAAIVAGAVFANADYLASYDRKHILAQAASIQARYGIVVATPEEILQAL